MDVLSDVLRAVELTGAVYFTFELSSPWVAEAPPVERVASVVMPGAERVIEYHVVTRGACWGGLVDEPAVHLEAGDVLVFPQGDPHVLSSAPGMRATPDLTLFRRPEAARLPFVHELGGGGPNGAHLICGFLGCDVRPYNPLLASLPRMIHLRAAGGAHGWLTRLIEIAVAESKTARAGGENVLARLSELMFVEVVRRHIDTLTPDQTGWLAGLRDAFVGRALGALHARPAHPWTLEQIAREAGLSRSTLAERFTTLVGQPPMQYLARWRMQLAARLLADGSAGVSEVAREVGYESEAAFSRAFKKLVGVAPSAWRRARAEGRHGGPAH